MLRSISISIVLFSYLILFNSCKKHRECFESRGAPTNDIRVITTPFNILQSFDKIEVYYIQDTTATSCTVRVATGKNLVANISTEVSNGTLQIKDNNKCNFERSDNSVTVYVTTAHITRFVQDGVGTMYSSNTIKEDSISYNVNNSGDIHLNLNVQWIFGRLYGVGDIYLSGSSQYPMYHLVNATGECFINAQNLQTYYTYIVYNSSGEAHINVSSQLDAEIDYSGNIYYNGNASVINKSGKGKGQLIKD